MPGLFARISPTGSAFQKNIVRFDVPVQNVGPLFVDSRRIVKVIRIDAKVQVGEGAGQRAENIPKERFRYIFVRMMFIVVFLVIVDVPVKQLLKIPSITIFNVQLGDSLGTSGYASVDESHNIWVFENV